MKELLETLQKKLENQLRQLEAETWEIEHILHLHGQKCCSTVVMEQPVDESLADEFIQAYINQEPWVVYISFDVYANMLFEENLKYFKKKNYQWDKILYLLAVKPKEWLEGKS